MQVGSTFDISKYILSHCNRSNFLSILIVRTFYQSLDIQCIILKHPPQKFEVYNESKTLQFSLNSVNNWSKLNYDYNIELADFNSEFELPTYKKVDRKLIIGSSLFGIGWGTVGFCPGPAISSISFFQPSSIIFLISMFVGFYLVRYIKFNRYYPLN